MVGAILLAAAVGVVDAMVPIASEKETHSLSNAIGTIASANASTNMPPRMVSVWKQAQRELRLTSVRQADGTLDAAAAARRREAVVRAFVRVCRNKGIPEAEIAHWQEKIR